MALGYLFTPGAIGGTLAVIAGTAAIIAKNCESGKSWFAKKFGDSWSERIWLKFFGLPLIGVGVLMWIPDHWWFDVAKLVGGFVVFIFAYRRWLKKETARKKADEDVGVSDATTS